MSQILVAETNSVLSHSCCVSVDGGMGLCSHLGMSYSLEPGMTGIPMGADGGFSTRSVPVSKWHTAHSFCQ